MGRSSAASICLRRAAIWLAMHKSNFEQQAEEQARKEQACQEHGDEHRTVNAPA